MRGVGLGISGERWRGVSAGVGKKMTNDGKQD